MARELLTKRELHSNQQDSPAELRQPALDGTAFGALDPIPQFVYRCLRVTLSEFQASLAGTEPQRELPAPLAALWWDAKGQWQLAHSLVDELETQDGMAVHAYLHRKEGNKSNAEYWYARASRKFHRADFAAEWAALVEHILASE